MKTYRSYTYTINKNTLQEDGTHTFSARIKTPSGRILHISHLNIGIDYNEEEWEEAVKEYIGFHKDGPLYDQPPYDWTIAPMKKFNMMAAFEENYVSSDI